MHKLLASLCYYKHVFMLTKYFYQDQIYYNTQKTYTIYYVAYEANYEKMKGVGKNSLTSDLFAPMWQIFIIHDTYACTQSIFSDIQWLGRRNASYQVTNNHFMKNASFSHGRLKHEISYDAENMFCNEL